MKKAKWICKKYSLFASASYQIEIKLLNSFQIAKFVLFQHVLSNWQPLYYFTQISHSALRRILTLVAAAGSSVSALEC